MEIVKKIPLSIKFIVDRKKNKYKGECSVYARILMNRDKALVSLGMTIQEKDWDFKDGKFKQNARGNSKLAEERDKIISKYEDLKRSDLPVTAKLIKKAYDGKVDENPDIEFMAYYDSYVAELKLRPDEYGEGVMGHYQKTKTHLQRFLKLQGWERIKMRDLSVKFLERFETYLLTTPSKKGKPINNNTCTTYIRKIKACVNAAIRKEILNKNPFAAFKLKSFKHANRVYLTRDELKVLKEHDLGGNYPLQKVRDCFVFCCATGLRHSDAVQLQEKMINKDENGTFWISLFQRKTKEYIELPMSNAAVEIYNRFEQHRKATGFVLPMLSNQKANTYLKVIGDLTGIGKKLSWHASRHTFATNSLDVGVDIAAISSLLGHRTVKTTQQYAKMTRSRKADVIEFLNKQKYV